ncbi:alkaline phosphatase family protein [soil metagenome]
MNTPNRFACVMSLVVASSACSGHRAGHFDDVPAHAPKLVVVVVIDQWPEWSFEQKQHAFSKGFARALTEGEWHVGHHPSAATLTAPGHALIGSGQPSAMSGILANEWWHRDLGVELHSAEAADRSSTAEWLRVNGLGDAVAAAKTGAKAVSVSLKDRASILVLGHAGTPVWYDIPTARWKTIATEPGWLTDYNQTNPVAARASQTWTPRDPKLLAQLSGTSDAQPGEVGEKGFGPTFPHDPAKTAKPGEAFYATPVGNELVFDAGLAAIAGEHLGEDQLPDLLVLSFSAHDYVGHGWGHESWEMWDDELRLDEQLGQFLDTLDTKLGAGNWAMLITSDHGASPLPERLDGGRITHEQIRRAANQAAAAVLGPGTWIESGHYPNVYFSKALLAQPKGELASATQRVMNALRAIPGVERVGRVSDYAGNCDKRTGEAVTLCLTFDAERSGELFYLPKRGWIVMDEDEPTATAHGSWYDYDQLVPLIMIQPDRGAKHPRVTAPESTIEMGRVSTLVARWLGVTPPQALPPRPLPALPVPPESPGSAVGSAGSSPPAGSGSPRR